FQAAGGADEETAGRPLHVAADADGDVETERDGIGEGEFHLRVATAGAEDADFREHSATGTDDGDGFFGGEVAFLIEPLRRSEGATLAEEDLDMLLREMAVPCGDVDDE